MFLNPSDIGDAPRPDTFIEVLRQAEASVAHAERGIARLAERLCGPRDEERDNPDGYPRPGILLEASDGAYSIIHRARAIEAALARIAEHLPPDVVQTVQEGGLGSRLGGPIPSRSGRQGTER